MTKVKHNDIVPVLSRYKNICFSALLLLCLHFSISFPAFADNELDIEEYKEEYYELNKEGETFEASKLALQIAQHYKRVNKIEEAIFFYKKALENGNGEWESETLANIYVTLGDLTADNQPKEALGYYKPAAEIFKRETYDMDAFAVVLYKAGNIYTKKKDFRNAISFFERSLDVCTENDNYPLALSCCKQLYIVYNKVGNTGKASFYNDWGNRLQPYTDEYIELKASDKRLTQLEDSLKNTMDGKSELEQEKKALNQHIREKAQHIKSLLKEKEKHELEIKEQTLALRLEKEKSEKNNILITAALLGFSMIGVALTLILRNNKKLKVHYKKIAQQNIEIEQQKELLEKEQSKAKKLLLNILPKAIADELSEKGRATPQYHDQVTVLFTDFSGFTKFAEQLSPAEIIAELDQHFMAFDEITEKYNLEKIKTIGDAYMCAGGIPIANSTNPIDTVKAGLEMVKYMDLVRAERKPFGKYFFDVRVGIHTGSVVAGVVGSKKFVYDIWGDTVNIAARMESSGEIRKVNISGDTYELIKNKFECEYRGKIKAKNKGEIDMFFVLNQKQDEA